MIYKDKQRGITRIRLWKLEIQYQEDSKSYYGNWKIGTGDRIVGSFTIIKKETHEKEKAERVCKSNK
jgi:hypothetical protein